MVDTFCNKEANRIFLQCIIFICISTAAAIIQLNSCLHLCRRCILMMNSVCFLWLSKSMAAISTNYIAYSLICHKKTDKVFHHTFAIYAYKYTNYVEISHKTELMDEFFCFYLNKTAYLLPSSINKLQDI